MVRCNVSLCPSLCPDTLLLSVTSVLFCCKCFSGTCLSNGPKGHVSSPQTRNSGLQISNKVRGQVKERATCVLDYVLFFLDVDICCHFEPSSSQEALCLATSANRLKREIPDQLNRAICEVFNGIIAKRGFNTRRGLHGCIGMYRHDLKKLMLLCSVELSAPS